MTRFKVAMVSMVAACVVIFAAVSPVMATPDWLPANVDIAGYTLQYEYTTDFYDIENPDQNATLYSQLWMKNDTSTNTTNLLAAGMLSNGGQVFSQSPQVTNPLYAELLEPQLAELLNISRAEYDQLETIWDVIVVLAERYVSEQSGMTVSEINVANMDKALLINASGGDFNYFLFGYAGSRVLGVFSISVESQWLTWLSNLQVYNDTLHDYMELYLVGFMQSFFLLFTSFATLLNSASGASSAPQASTIDTNDETAGASIATSAISPSQDTELNEVIAFASAWGEIANPAAAPADIPGFTPWALVAASAIAISLIVVKVRARSKRTRA